MIERNTYESIKKEFGDFASWAVWAIKIDKAKSGIGDMSVFKESSLDSLLTKLKSEIIMVGLNCSRDIESNTPFKNFHDSQKGNDFKIRFAFENTDFYGAYMTDIIKDFPELNSKKVVDYFKKNRDEVSPHIETFKRELNLLGAQKPIILAFGTGTYEIIKDNLSDDSYKHLIKLPHYSQHISEEDYRVKVHQKIYQSTGMILDRLEYLKKVNDSLREYASVFSKLNSIQNLEELDNLQCIENTLSECFKSISQLKENYRDIPIS